MISFFKKLLFCVGFCLLLATNSKQLHALDHGPDIARATETLRAMISGLTQYQSATADQRAISDNLIVQFNESALSNQTSLPDGIDDTQFGNFLRNTLDDEIKKLDVIKSNNGVPAEIRNYVEIIQNAGAVLAVQFATANLSTVPGPDSGGNVTGTLANDSTRLTTQQAADNAEDPSSCRVTLNGFDTYKCLQSVVSWVARTLFVNVPMFIFYLCGIFLDFSISFGLTTMKTLVNDEIYNLWLFTRNLVLAASLFSFLYFIGMVIVGLGSSIQRAAASVILFALFSGFSFSVSTYLIDISNLVTTSLYNSVDSGWEKHSAEDPVIATKFIQYLGYRSIVNAVTGPQGASLLGRITLTGLPQIVGLNLLVGLSLIYNAYVLLMMALLFVVRDLGLIVGVVFSPLMLVDQAVPKLSELAKKFRSFFIGQLILGPVFMFLMYIGLKISKIAGDGVSQLGGKTGAGVGSSGVILFQILIITAVFWYTYKTCKSLSGVLGEATLGALGGIAQKAMMATPLGLAGQAASFVGKSTIGRVARHASREEGFLNKNQERFGLKGAFNAMNYAGNKATYDFNNSKVFAGAAQKAGMSSSVGGGFVSKGLGYADARQAAIAQAERHAKDTENPEIRTKLVEDTLSKFRRSNVTGSKVDQKDFEKMQTQARKSSASGQKSSLTDQVNDINFEDLHSNNETKKKAALAKLTELREKAEKGGGEVQKWFSKYTQNKILTETTNAIKDDDTLNPESDNFSAEALAKYKANLEVMLTAGLGLDKMKQVGGEKKEGAEAISRKMVTRLTTEIQQIVTEKKRQVVERRKVSEKYDATNPDRAVGTPLVSTQASNGSNSDEDAGGGTQVDLEIIFKDDFMNSLPGPSASGNKRGGDTSLSSQNSQGPQPKTPSPQTAEAVAA